MGPLTSDDEPERGVDYAVKAGEFLSIMDEMAPQIALDYSVESLQRLDQFISEHFDVNHGRQVDETLPVGIGAYVGEVIIRHIGGNWHPDGKPEVNSIGPIAAVFPLEKAHKRFTNGKQDSLSWYYHAIVKKAYEAGYEPDQNQLHARHSVHHATQTVPADAQDGLLGIFKGLFSKK